jgi:hypothetical protein
LPETQPENKGLSPSEEPTQTFGQRQATASNETGGSYEPKWKTFLNWAAVITWFMMPLLVFTLQCLSEEQWMKWIHFNEHMAEFKWLGSYYRDLTFLVFSLAGLQVLNRKFPDATNGKK